MNKGFLLSVLFILSFVEFGMSQEHDSHQIYNHVQSLKEDFNKESRLLFSANRNLNIPPDADLYVKKANYLVLEDSYIDEIKSIRPKTLFLDLPIEGEIFQVLLYRKEVTISSYKVRAASGATTHKSESVFYRGIVKDVKKSFVGLSILNNQIHMTVSVNSDNYEINKIGNGLYAAYKVSDSKHTQDTQCSSDQLLENKNVEIKEKTTSRSTGDCIEIYIECDFDSYQQNGSSIQNTEDWALAIMNEVEILYENEGVPLVVSDILVYDQPDPYLAGGDSNDMLDIMLNEIVDYNGRLAHVFSTRSVGGGIAWLNVLCADNNGFSGPFAVSGSMNTNIVPFPIYSWNVGVVAHELGHNIGSRHTHDCVWNGDNTQIDDCGSEWGDVAFCYDENNPILPAGGTIMSYCHLIGSVGIDFNNGFGPQPGALLLDRYLSAGCVTGEDCSGFENSGSAPIADFAFTQFSLCTPSEVQFTDLSTESPTQYEWFFPGGTPDFSTAQNPFVVYEQTGFYDVTLTVTNADGSDELTLSQIIEVIETPVPDFIYELLGDSISFTNQTNMSVDSYFWEFGDGYVSNIENPSHAYEEEGIYTVMLTVGSICGMTTVEQTVEVFLSPTAAFSIDTTFGCSPLMVNFSNSSSDNVEALLWIFEGGTPETSIEENPSVLYDEAGVYDVKLIVTNDVGQDSIVETSFISIEEEPTAAFSFSIEDLAVDFSNMSAGYDTLQWDFGDGSTSTLEEPTHTYESEDLYTVILRVINRCDTVIMMQSVNLTSLPIAGYSADVTDGCLPHTVTFTNSSSNNVNEWLWNFPGGEPSSSTEENPIVVYESAGNYDVSLIVSNEMGEDSLLSIDLISIMDVPMTDFDYSLDNFIVEFTDQSSDYGSLSWNFGDGNVSSEQNPIYTYEEEGTYEVVLSTTNSCGTTEKSQSIIISTQPMADYSVSITDGCIPLTVEYSDNSSSNVTGWIWDFPGGTPSSSTEENPSVTYTESGIYDVSLIVNSMAGSDTVSREEYIVTRDVPTANFEFSILSVFEYSFSNTSSEADSYLWDFGDGNTSTEVNSVHTYSEQGTYLVRLSVTNICGTETYEEEISVTETTSIDGLEVMNDINISPNPNNGNFLVSMKVNVPGDVLMEVYNVLGQKVKSAQFSVGSGNNILPVQLENQKTGAYLILLKRGEQNRVLKFLIH